MTFDEVLDRATELLRRRQRVAYRAIKAQFGLDDEAMEALKDELVYAQRVARDEDGRVLVWCGRDEPAREGTPDTTGPGPPGSSREAGAPDPSSLDEWPPEAERRQLTVLFCDLAGSAALSSELDPEDLREVIRAYQDACAGVVARLGGHIAQYLGDGLLVYFGYPHAHEDDACRAIRAGREIVDAVGDLNRRLEHAKRVRLAVRVGIHTGLVVVGEVGAGTRREQLALGETPNVAARLQGLAQRDTVVISEATLRLAEGYFVCRDLGAPDLKGIATAVSVHQVLGESGARSRLDIPTARGLTPLVGRASEVSLLLERWAQARDGLGQAVMLSGEPGIGKSRLVQVLRERVADEAHVWECRCSPHHNHSALYPVIDLFQRIIRRSPHDTPDATREKLEGWLLQERQPVPETFPFLAALLSVPLPEGRDARPVMTPQQQKQKIMDTIRTVLVELAERRPVLVIAEDLHWVDPSTQELLTALVEQVAGARILILLTCRPEFLSAWGSRAHLTRLALHRLAHAHVAQMVEGVTGGKALPTELTHQIVTRTDGIPLFVEELIKAVLESGWLREGADHYTVAAPVPPLGIPATLRDALTARLDRLGAAKTVAQLGATIGRVFTYDVLRAAALMDEAALQNGLRRLIDAELLYARGVPPHASYTFKHALVQEAAYQSLLKRTRQQYHERIARALETRLRDIAVTQPELLAHHLTEAGAVEEAIVYWERAGQRAVERSAHAEAVSHLRRGLALLETLPESRDRARREIDFLSVLGMALVATNGQAHPNVERTYARARDLCRQTGEPQRFLTGLQSVYIVRAELRAARAVAEEFEHLAEAQRDIALRPVVRWALGHCSFLEGDLASARAHLEEGIALGDSQPRHPPGHASGFPADVGVFSRCFAAHTLWHLGYPEQALRRSGEAVALAEQLAHPFSRAVAQAYATMLHQFLGDRAAVLESAETTIALCREHGFPYYLAWATVIQGWALTAEAQGEAGIARMRAGLTEIRATGAELRQPYYLALLAQAYGEIGQVDAGLSLLTEALAEANRTGEHWRLAELHRLRGELLARSHDDSGAEVSLREALSLARRQQAKALELRAAVSMARLWRRQGASEARALLEPVYEWFTEGFATADLQEARALLASLV